MRRFALLVIGLLVACGKAPSLPQAARTDSAGIEIVANSGIDHPLTWPVTASDTLFDPASDTVLQGEARALNIGADAQGRLVFADGGFSDRRVLRQEGDGSLHQLGQRGAGPGEYQMVGGISVSPSGEVLVTDYAKQAFVRFGPDDAILPNIPWSIFGHGYSQGGGYAGGGIVTIFGEMSESTSVNSVRLQTPTDTVVMAELHEPARKMVMFEACHVGFAGGEMFHPSPRWTGNAELVALVTGDRYEIEVWRGSKRIRSIRRDLAPRAATKALAMQELGEGQKISFGGGPPCLIPASDIVEKQGVAPSIPAIKRLAMAMDGTLWVERFTVKGETPLRDIFDSTGAYLGTLAGEIPWPQVWLPDGRFVAVSANADSLPVVVRYAVGGPVRNE